MKNAPDWTADDLCEQTGVIIKERLYASDLEPTREEVETVLKELVKARDRYQANYNKEPTMDNPLVKLGYLKEQLSGRNKNWFPIYTWNTAPRQARTWRTVHRAFKRAKRQCLIPVQMLLDCCVFIMP